MERFYTHGDLIRYTRQITLIDGSTSTFELHMTQKFMNDLGKDELRQYLDKAVAEHLTLNGVDDAD